MSANDIQFGGDHYKKAAFQPWDWDRYGVGYLECNVIKYVTRHRNKNGIVDLQKAAHYTQKLYEDHDHNSRCNRIPFHDNLQLLLDAYYAAWNLNTTECAIVATMIRWTTGLQLQQAMIWIQELIRAYSTSDVQSSESVESPATK